MDEFYESLELEINRRVEAELNEPGLFPVWSPDVTLEHQTDGSVLASRRHLAVELDAEILQRLDQPELNAAVPACRWPRELLALWKLGIIYFRDSQSSIAPTVQLDDVRSLILRRSALGHFTVLRLGPLLFVDSQVGTHNFFQGTAAVVQSTIHCHCYIGRTVFVDGCFFASYAKAQVGVKITGSLIGAYAGFDGGTHAEQYPLSGDGRVPEGVVVGANNWIGHHAAVLAGAHTGEGVVVAAGTVLNKPVSSHVLLVGAPPRALPIDLHIRNSTAEAAFAAGRTQGPTAAALPVYGMPRAEFTSATRLTIEYPEHGLSQQLVGERLVDFQRGALVSFFGAVLPERSVVSTHDIGGTVRFDFEFDAPPPPVAVVHDDMVLGARSPEETGEQTTLSPNEDALVSVLRKRSMTLREVVANADEIFVEPLDGPTRSAIVALLHGLSAAKLLTVCLKRGDFWRHRSLRPILERLACPPNRESRRFDG